MKNTQLPDKPSELIRLALKDLRKTERQFWKYKIDMDIWHSGKTSTLSRCSVCLAGAVMAQTLKTPISLRGGDNASGPNSKSFAL